MRFSLPGSVSFSPVSQGTQATLHGRGEETRCLATFLGGNRQFRGVGGGGGGAGRNREEERIGEGVGDGGREGRG